MKVLFIASLYYPHVGGIETVVTELSAQYARQNIQSVVLTKRWPISLPRFSHFQGIPIYRIVSAKNKKDFHDVIEWLRENEEKIRCDIIHVIGMRHPLPLFALLLARRWQVPIVSTIAGSEIPEKSDPQTFEIWKSSKDIMIPVLSQSDTVTAFSNGLIKNAHWLVKLRKQKIQLLYAGLHVAQFAGAKKSNLSQPYILCVRRLVRSKGVDILIEAFKQFSFKIDGVILVVAGDGPEKEKLMTQVKKLGIENKVKFIGTVSLKVVASLLKGALMNIVPSRSEGGGLINLEAQAAGCALIASRVGGIPEYVRSDKTGILFEVGNVSQLTKKMIYLYKNKKERDTLIKNGKKFAQQFDWEILTSQYVNMYSKLIRNYSPKPFLPWSILTKKLWKNFQ